MADYYSRITDEQAALIRNADLFFVATADPNLAEGVHGEGPTVKRVFLDAARKGFAKKGWRKVYADYSEVAEEMLDKESLPAGRRAIVQRYFELIRPRLRSGKEE